MFLVKSSGLDFFFVVVGTCFWNVGQAVSGCFFGAKLNMRL